MALAAQTASTTSSVSTATATTELTQADTTVSIAAPQPQAESNIPQVIALLAQLGLPALPVAPAQDPYQFPKLNQGDRKKAWPHCPLTQDFKPEPRFTGKNPSYLDRNGKPNTINHRDYQKRLPSAKERKAWWQNPQNGIGTLGGWDGFVWIDLDVKQFESQDECDRAFHALLEAHPQLRETWLERTHSGGYRIGVQVKEKPTFTNFALEAGGVHRGEALGEGRFTVLAPTIGVSGNPYHCIQLAPPVEVDSLESIDIFPVRSDREPRAPQRQKREPIAIAGSIALEQLGTEKAASALAGDNFAGDRSATVTAAYREWSGWENWTASNGIAVSSSAADLAHQAGEALGLDADKVDRILKGIDPASCQPAAQYKGGDESCWQKIKRLARTIFEAVAPPAVREALKTTFTKGKPKRNTRKQTANDRPTSGDRDLPKPSIIARELAERYRPQLAWHVPLQEWYRYEAQLMGTWSSEPEEFIAQIVRATLEEHPGNRNGYSLGYVNNVIGLLKHDLAVRKWDQADHLLPVENGTLDLRSGKLVPHAPGHHLTWQLPYAYDPTATCDPIIAWLSEAQQGDAQRVQLLRAYLKAIIMGRVDLQRYLECLGPAGTGKSTYTRLAIALVGVRNTFTTELKQLENNRFEIAGLVNKKLLIITDSERYGGTVSVLKAITGQDPLRLERKFKQQGEGGDFYARLLVLIAANEAVQSADYTSGLQRRRLTAPFLHQVAPEYRRDLLTIDHNGVSGEFANYLPGLLNWVLAMPDREMEAFVKNTIANVPSLRQAQNEALLETNPIAEWLDHCCVFDLQAKTYVGVAKREKSQDSSNTFQLVESWLYASYKEYCLATGSNAVSSRRFTGLLEDLCKSQLHVSIERDRDNRGSYFVGIAIRSDRYEAFPRPITNAGATDAIKVTGQIETVMDQVVAETTTSDGSVGCDGFFEAVPQVLVQVEIQSAGVAEVNPEVARERDQCEVGFAQNPSHPSNEPLASTPADTAPITESAAIHHQTAEADLLSPQQLAEFIKILAAVDSIEAFKSFYGRYQSKPPAQQQQIADAIADANLADCLYGWLDLIDAQSQSISEDASEAVPAPVQSTSLDMKVVSNATADPALAEPNSLIYKAVSALRFCTSTQEYKRLARQFEAVLEQAIERLDPNPQANVIRIRNYVAQFG